MWWNSKFWRNSVIILDFVKYGILPETEMEFKYTKIYASRFFLLQKKAFLGWGKPSSEKVLNSKQISLPLEKNPSYAPAHECYSFLHYFPKLKFCIFLYIPKTFKDNSE